MTVSNIYNDYILYISDIRYMKCHDGDDAVVSVTEPQTLRSRGLQELLLMVAGITQIYHIFVLFFMNKYFINFCYSLYTKISY